MAPSRNSASTPSSTGRSTSRWATNAFNWIALDVGANPLYDVGSEYDVAFVAQLDATAASLGLFGADYAAAGVGKRTMIIEPVKLQVGDTVAPSP